MKKVTCSGCGAEYELRSFKIPMRDKDSVECEICNIQLYSWNEAKMWTATLIKKKEVE